MSQTLEQFNTWLGALPPGERERIMAGLLRDYKGRDEQSSRQYSRGEDLRATPAPGMIDTGRFMVAGHPLGFAATAGSRAIGTNLRAGAERGARENTALRENTSRAMMEQALQAPGGVDPVMQAQMTGEGDPAVLARTLGGRRDLGAALAGSTLPGVAAGGAAQATQATGAAANVGSVLRRTQELRKSEEERSRPKQGETWIDPTNPSRSRVVRPLPAGGFVDAVTNQPITPDELRGMRPASSTLDRKYAGGRGGGSGGGAKVFAPREDEFGIMYFPTKTGEAFFLEPGPDGERVPYNRGLSEQYARGALPFNELAAQAKAAGTAAGKSAIERADALVETASGYGRLAGLYDEGVAAIGEGAESGPISQYIISLTQPTIALDRVGASLTLEKLATIPSLTPVSDKDLRLVRQSVAPPAEDEKVTAARFIHAAEVARRMQAVARANERSLRENKKSITEEQANSILTAGGFDLTPPPTSEAGSLRWVLTDKMRKDGATPDEIKRVEDLSRGQVETLLMQLEQERRSGG